MQGFFDREPIAGPPQDEQIACDSYDGSGRGEKSKKDVETEEKNSSPRRRPRRHGVEIEHGELVSPPLLDGDGRHRRVVGA